jgi:hypothetical protein
LEAGFPTRSSENHLDPMLGAIVGDLLGRGETLGVLLEALDPE